MRNNRIRIEFIGPELRIQLDLCAKELLRQITHNAIDPDLANLVKKLARNLARLTANKQDTPGS